MKKFWGFLKKCGSWAWKIIGVLAVLFGVYVGYHDLFSTPSISARTSTETNVLNVNESLKNLQILYQGNDIQANNQNLRIYHVLFQNNGDANITQNDFDDKDPWGIRIEQGQIVDARVADSDSEYITNNLHPQIDPSGSSISFNKIIFDKGSEFTVELLVLHNKNTVPELYRTGKIAGILKDQSEILPTDQGKPFISALVYGSLYGDFWVNLTRFIIAFLVSIVLFVAGLVLIVWIQEARKRRQQAPQPPQQPSL